MNTRTAVKVDPLLREKVAASRTYSADAAPVDGTAFLQSQVRIKAAFDKNEPVRRAKRDAKRARRDERARSTHLTGRIADEKGAELLKTLFPKENG